MRAAETATVMRGFVITLRPIVSMVALPWAGGMAIFASALYGNFQNPMFSDTEFYLKLFLIIFASFLGVAGGYALNDYFDYAADKANPARTDKAANHGIGRRTLLAYALIMGIPSMSIWFYLSYRALAVAFVLFLCILAYSGWGKRNTPFSNLLVVASVAIMPIAIFYVYTTQLTLAAVLLGVANLFFEPGFTWSGTCRDIDGDRKMGIPTMPLRYGIPAVSKIVLGSWLLVIPSSLALFFYTDLGTIFLAGSTVAGLWLVALAARFVREPTASTGGSTFLKAALWLWVFSFALIFDVVFLLQ
ncbi:UbiA prenyltransferase family protein [Chloroflexota bacterium]